MFSILSLNYTFAEFAFSLQNRREHWFSCFPKLVSCKVTCHSRPLQSACIYSCNTSNVLLVFVVIVPMPLQRNYCFCLSSWFRTDDVLDAFRWRAFPLLGWNQILEVHVPEVIAWIPGYLVAVGFLVKFATLSCYTFIELLSARLFGQVLAT